MTSGAGIKVTERSHCRNVKNVAGHISEAAEAAVFCKTGHEACLSLDVKPFGY